MTNSKICGTCGSANPAVRLLFECLDAFHGTPDECESPHDLARQSFVDTKALKIAKELSVKHAAALQKLADGSSPIPTSVLRGIEQARRDEGREIDVSDLDTSSEMLTDEDPENVTRWKMSVGRCVGGPCVMSSTEMDGEWVTYEDHRSCVTEAERHEAKRWLEVQLMVIHILIDSRKEAAVEMRDRAAEICKEAATNLFQQRNAEFQPSLWDMLITTSTAILSLKME